MKKFITFFLFIGLIALSLWGYFRLCEDFNFRKKEIRQFYRLIIDKQKKDYQSKIKTLKTEKKSQSIKIEELEKKIKSLKENANAVIVDTYNPYPKQQQRVNCSTCYGSGKCRHCGGDGRTPCTLHDTNNDGYCTNCSNTRQENCYMCSSSSGICGTCYGSGKVSI